MESIYTPNSEKTELILKIENPENNLWGYAFFENEVPEYLQEHARRNLEAENTDTEIKLSRMVEQHLNEDAEKEWR